MAAVASVTPVGSHSALQTSEGCSNGGAAANATAPAPSKFSRQSDTLHPCVTESSSHGRPARPHVSKRAAERGGTARASRTSGWRPRQGRHSRVGKRPRQGAGTAPAARACVQAPHHHSSVSRHSECRRQRHAVGSPSQRCAGLATRGNLEVCLWQVSQSHVSHSSRKAVPAAPTEPAPPRAHTGAPRRPRPPPTARRAREARRQGAAQPWGAKTRASTPLRAASTASRRRLRTRRARHQRGDSPKPPRATLLDAPSRASNSRADARRTIRSHLPGGGAAPRALFTSRVEAQATITTCSCQHI